MSQSTDNSNDTTKGDIMILFCGNFITPGVVIVSMSLASNEFARASISLLETSYDLALSGF